VSVSRSSRRAWVRTDPGLHFSMRKIIRAILAGGLVAVAACGASSAETAAVATNTAEVSAEITDCQARARAADAGTNLHVYDVCMANYGLHDAGGK
jgi:hypothetical protein